MEVKLEICAYSLESCMEARKGGADRVELCTGMHEGGLTPSVALVDMARELTEGMELYVMIRPREGDFLYSQLEYEQMKREIKAIKERDVDGVVVGFLTKEGRIDIERTQEIVQLAAPLRVTFHRAFDMSCDYRQALEDVIATGCHRILTSGQYQTALEGIEVIRTLVGQAQGRIEIMAGSGVNAGNASLLMQTGVNALHMSGKSSRESRMVYQNSRISMGGSEGVAEYAIAFSDHCKIKEVKKILSGMV